MGHFWSISGPPGPNLMPPNPKFKLKQVILYAPNQFQLFPIQLSHFDPSKLTKLIVEPFLSNLGHFWPILGPRANFGNDPNPLICPTRLDWMSLGGKCVPSYHNCNICIESALPVHCAEVSVWGFLAPKIITQIGGCGAKISHGYDPRAVFPP